MIALTQEKREELIAYANAAIKECEIHGEYYTPRPEMMVDALKVALASLTAEPIAHADSKAILKMIKGHTRFFTSFPERSEARRVGLFITPPVPEIKLIEPADFIRKWNNSDDCPLAGLSAKSAANKAVSTYAQEIKRLNGSGE